MTASEKQKHTEKMLLEQVRKLDSTIPLGEIDNSGECPDLIIETPSGGLGVEVTQLVATAPNGFSSRAVHSFHEDVVRQAEEIYSQIAPEPVGVLAICSGDCETSRATAAEWLASFVLAKIEAIKDCQTFSGPDDLMTGFSVVRIAKQSYAREGGWLSGEVGGSSAVPYEAVQRAISKKDAKLQKYRKLSGVWLLIVVDMFPGTATYWVPDSCRGWRFSCEFDRILLYDRQWSTVIELGKN